MSRPGPVASGVASRYRQVYGHLKALLIDSKTDPSVPLPSEPALAARYRVSRVTIRRTLDLLEAEGIVRRVRGVGTFPVERKVQAQRRDIGGMLDSILSYEGMTTVRNLEWAMVTPAEDIGRLLRSGHCLRIVRVREHEGHPISLTTLHVPGPLAGLLDGATATDEPIIAILDRKGVRALRADQVITAVAADGFAAEALAVHKGSPLVMMKRLMMAEDQQPVLHQASLYAPDRFEYRMSLARGSVESAARWTPIA